MTTKGKGSESSETKITTKEIRQDKYCHKDIGMTLKELTLPPGCAEQYQVIRPFLHVSIIPSRLSRSELQRKAEELLKTNTQVWWNKHEANIWLQHITLLPGIPENSSIPHEMNQINFASLQQRHSHFTGQETEEPVDSNQCFSVWKPKIRCLKSLQAC